MDNQEQARLNPRLGQFKKKASRTVEAYIDGINSGNRILLGEAITVIESRATVDQELALKIVDQCQSQRTSTIRVGVTGPPGVGKSTLLEALGLHLIEQHNQKVAILAIDPSSAVSHGSILGDKTRMTKLASHPNAFIRPTSAGNAHGGVAHHTRETIMLCEAAGYDWVFVETVGVGQSEFLVHELTDCFLLLLMPGAGDELQGIKRGIVEMADIIAIQKADGDRQAVAEQSRLAYQNANRLLTPKVAGWKTPVMAISAMQNKGMDQLINLIMAFEAFQRENQNKIKKRQEQAVFWLKKHIETYLHHAFFENDVIKSQYPPLEAAVYKGALSPMTASKKLIELFSEANRSR